VPCLQGFLCGDTSLFCRDIVEQVERGVAVLDTSTRGRSTVVLEVRFRSRALFKAEIQSEIVPGYLYYLGFCTV